MTDYPFRKGDFVVYGTGGVCQVEEVGELSFGASSQCYYTLRPTADQSSLTYVPCANETLTAKLRTVMSKQEIESILASHLDAPVTWEGDRKLRLAKFHEILSKCDPTELLSLIRCIMQKQKELEASNRRLSLSDGELLRTALFSVNSEFSFALGIEKDEVAGYIRAHLDTKDII